jgi:peptidoglycan/LPS O-acetylase OafA/YrhL
LIQLELGKTILPPGAVRLLLAFTVVASHDSRFDIGRLAVLVFFYLSGYWVGKVWVEKFGSKGLFRFYVARYLRIAPLYLIVMFSSAWLLATRFSIENITVFGVASSDTDPLGVSWSLDVELQFYVLLPLILPLFQRYPVWAGVIGFAVSVFAWLVFGSTSLVTAFQYLVPFILGMLTYTCAWRPSERFAIASLVSFGLVTLGVYFTSFIDKNIPDPFDRDIFATAWMLPLLPYVARSLSVKGGAADRHFGNLSFPLYLVHYPAITWMTSLLGHGVPGRLSGIVLATVAATILYFALDRRIDSWRVALTERPRLPAVAPIV